MRKIHPTAVVEPGAELADDVVIGPYCTVSAEAVIGREEFLFPTSGKTTTAPTIHPLHPAPAPSEDCVWQDLQQLLLGSEDL